MPELTFNEIIQVLGVSGFLGYLLLAYHNSVSKQFNKILDNQNEREKATFAQLNKIIDNQSDREKNNFNLLKQMIDTNLLQNAHLEKIESMIKNNTWCPYARKILGAENEHNITTD